MNFKNAASVVATVAAFFAQSAIAQTAPDAKTRADVKAETAAAKKKGELVSAGEGTTPTDKTAAKSTKPRAEVKAETAAAKKKGELMPPGEGTVVPPTKK